MQQVRREVEAEAICPSRLTLQEGPVRSVKTTRFHCSASNSVSQKSELSASLRPVTICQLNKATQQHSDAEWRLEEIELGQASSKSRPSRPFADKATGHCSGTSHPGAAASNELRLPTRRWLWPDRGKTVDEHRDRWQYPRRNQVRP